MDDDEPILDQVGKLWDAVSQLPVTRWGTVETVTPLTVLLDPGTGDPASASSVAGALTVGDRVFCVVQNRKVVVLGAS